MKQAVRVAEAQEIVLRCAQPVGVEKVALLEALHRVTAEEVTAQRHIPPEDNSAMDGYAVRAADAVRRVAAGVGSSSGPVVFSNQSGVHSDPAMINAGDPIFLNAAWYNDSETDIGTSSNFFVDFNLNGQDLGAVNSTGGLPSRAGTHPILPARRRPVPAPPEDRDAPRPL